MSERDDLPFISLPEDEGGAVRRGGSSEIATLERRPQVIVARAPAAAQPVVAGREEGCAAESVVTQGPDELLRRLNEQHKAIEETLRNYARLVREREDAKVRAISLETDLAATRKQLQAALSAIEQGKEVQAKLDAMMTAHSMLAAENAKLKQRESEMEERAKLAELRVANLHAEKSKAETARYEAERKIVAALTALQG